MSNCQTGGVTKMSTYVVRFECYGACMDKRERAELFAKYVGLALKGRIITQGRTAKAVAEQMRRSPAAFNRWLNGKVELPISVFAEACEVIDVEPHTVIEDAYSRLCIEHGERDGSTYDTSDDDYSYPGELTDNVIDGVFDRGNVGGQLEDVSQLKRVAHPRIPDHDDGEIKE